ncbi:ABC transporter permease [Pseudonocardiaceae bacterium YIM PH 21723]|nr:ABC transporter permease [Pseudonocardiaceae bacterium YIM PH 21723]
MIWVSYRQQRTQLITLLAILVLGAAAVLLLRSSMVGDLARLGLENCHGASPAGLAECSKKIDEFQKSWYDTIKLGMLGLLLLPVLIGMFIGAPLFAREFEQGTHVLATSQSVSRVRWALSKILVGLLPALAVLLILQKLVSWWALTAGEFGPLDGGPYSTFIFGSANIAPLTYTLFAFCLGMFVGALARRVLVGMTVTLGVFVALRAFLGSLQDRLLPTERIASPVEVGFQTPKGALNVGMGGYLDASGQAVPYEQSSKITQQCFAEGVKDTYACLRDHGLTGTYADAIPVSQAGTMHLIEGSIFLVLTALLVAGTILVLRRQS